MSWFEDGKLSNLTTINLCNARLNDKFVSMLVDTIVANKLPLLEKIELDGSTIMSAESQDLLHNAIEQLQTRRIALASYK